MCQGCMSRSVGLGTVKLEKFLHLLKFVKNLILKKLCSFAKKIVKICRSSNFLILLKIVNFVKIS